MINSSNFIEFGMFSFRRGSFVLFYLLPLALCLLTVGQVRAQEEIPANIAPPPILSISKNERSALDGIADVKNRTKLAIELMEVRLKNAESLNTQESYENLLTELGSFQALMNNALRFLNSKDDGRGKVMDTYKKFEIALRAFMPRIELIRRELPEKFEYHVRTLLKSVRETRAKAVEPFFGETVLPDRDN